VKLKTFVVLICASALWSACSGAGGSPTAPSSPASATPPSASLQRAINTVVSGVIASMNATRAGSKSLTLSDDGLTGGFLAGPRSITVQCNPSGTSCSTQFNESFTQQTNCVGGGVSSVSSTLTGVIQASGTTVSGTLNMAGRSTFAACSENGWVTNSNPSIGTNGSIFITGQRTRINLTMSGGFVMTNAPGTPNGRATCVFNSVILQWDDITGNWANSGSVDCTPGGSFRF
jgi:hypothetical protein